MCVFGGGGAGDDVSISPVTYRWRWETEGRCSKSTAPDSSYRCPHTFSHTILPVYANWGCEKNYTEWVEEGSKKRKKCVDKEAEATLSTLSPCTVVSVRVVMGRLIGLAGDTEDVPW